MGIPDDRDKGFVDVGEGEIDARWCVGLDAVEHHMLPAGGRGGRIGVDLSETLQQPGAGLCVEQVRVKGDTGEAQAGEGLGYSLDVTALQAVGRRAAPFFRIAHPKLRLG